MSHVLFGTLNHVSQIGMLIIVFFLALILHKFVELPAIKTGWNPRQKIFLATPLLATLCLAGSLAIYVSEGMADRFPDRYQNFFLIRALVLIRLMVSGVSKGRTIFVALNETQKRLMFISLVIANSHQYRFK